MSAYLVVLVSVLAAATATLTLNLLARLDWRHARAWTRPAAANTPPEPEGLLAPRQGPCGCLTVTGAIAVLHEQGYLPFGQLGSGGELLANGEAAAAVWPAPPERITAVQFGTLSLGPAHQQPASHLDAAALVAVSRTHRATLASHPASDSTAQPEVFELVYPLVDPPPAQHAAPRRVAEQTLAQEPGPAAERPDQEW
jgi:hypothetical protein